MAAADRPNIVLVLADDLGFGDLGCYGSPTIQTPNLDNLARGGVRLTSFYSAPTCVPARTQLMVGKYSGRVNPGRVGPGGTGGLPVDEPTLAEELKHAGYETAAIGKWHLGYLDKFLPTNRGFDSWLGLPYSQDAVKPWVRTDVPLWLYENTKPVEHPVVLDTLTERYTQRAVDFIRRARSAPFFLYFAPAMPHLPLAVGKNWRGKSRAGLYGDAVEEIDGAVGRLLEAVASVGKSRDTIVIFASDNGPWINPPLRMLQGGNLPWQVGSAGTLRMGKETTYEGGVRVPAIIHWPGHFEGGWSSAELTATMDVFATLVHLGTRAPPRTRVDGYDLTAFLERRTPKSPRQDFFYFNSQKLEGIRSGPWKLRMVGGIELFNLDLDPAELHNREKDRPEIVATLKARLEEMKGATQARHQ